MSGFNLSLQWHECVANYRSPNLHHKNYGSCHSLHTGRQLFSAALYRTWEIDPATYVAGLLQQAIKRAYHELVLDLLAVGFPVNA